MVNEKAGFQIEDLRLQILECRVESRVACSGEYPTENIKI